MRTSCWCCQAADGSSSSLSCTNSFWELNALVVDLLATAVGGTCKFDELTLGLHFSNASASCFQEALRSLSIHRLKSLVLHLIDPWLSNLFSMSSNSPFDIFKKTLSVCQSVNISVSCRTSDNSRESMLLQCETVKLDYCKSVVGCSSSFARGFPLQKSPATPSSNLQ